MPKSKIKNIILSLMAIHAEMRAMDEKKQMQEAIDTLRKLVEKMK